MKEDFLHYLWRFQKLFRPSSRIVTTAPIRVVHPGIPNRDEGPDFYDAKLWIGDPLWAGAVELHLKSSFWYHHRHHLDKRYDSVILHVVWEEDVEVCYPSGRLLPCLELSKRISTKWVDRYYKTFWKNTPLDPLRKKIWSLPKSSVAKLERTSLHRAFRGENPTHIQFVKSK